MLLVCYKQFESVFKKIKNRNLTFELVKLLKNMEIFALVLNLFNVVGAHGFEP